MHTFRIAVAGRYADRHIINNTLREAKLDLLPGVEITASWLDSRANSDGDLTPEEARAQVDVNRREIILSHLLLYFPCWSREIPEINQFMLIHVRIPVWSPGRLIDYGIAIGHGIKILIVGKPEESIYFYGHDAVTVCEPSTLHEAVKAVMHV